MANVNLCHWFIILVLWFNISLYRFSKSIMLTNYKSQKIHPNKIPSRIHIYNNTKYAIRFEKKKSNYMELKTKKTKYNVVHHFSFPSKFL